MRNTPVIIFINKMDREAKDPFDLLDDCLLYTSFLSIKSVHNSTCVASGC